MESKSLNKSRILEAAVTPHKPHILESVIAENWMHFVSRPQRPEFMRNYSRRKLDRFFNKPRLERKTRPSLINNEIKEWEVRFGEEKDGPLDAQEVNALLKACNSEFSIKNMKTGKTMTRDEFKNYYINGEPQPVTRYKQPIIMEQVVKEKGNYDFSRFIGFNNKDDSIPDELLKYGGHVEWEEPGGDPESLGERTNASPVYKMEEQTQEIAYDDDQCVIEEVIGRDQIQRMSKMDFDQNLDILRNNEIFLSSPKKKKPKKKKKNPFDRLKQLNRIKR